MNRYLKHHGVLGMKWGIRRYQNYDGSLINPKRIRKLEKKAIDREYKRSLDNGGYKKKKRYRYSTGENFNRAEKGYKDFVMNDDKYWELSKKAHDLEVARINYEKKVYENDYHKDWEDYIENFGDTYNKDKKYWKIVNDSEQAAKEKNKRLDQLSKDYVNVIKEAKLKDLNITKNTEAAKKYLSGEYYHYIYDDNWEYNVDDMYDPYDGWDDTLKRAKFKRGFME